MSKNKNVILYSFALAICPLLFLSTKGFSQAEKVTVKSADKKALKHFRESGHFLNSKEFEKSLASLQKTISIEPNFIDAHMRMGDIYAFFEDLENARKSYYKVIAIDPDHIKDVYLMLGELESFNGNYSAAIPHLEKYLSYSSIIYSRKLRAQRALNNSRFGASALANPIPFKPINSGDSVNTPISEYHPSITTDGQALLFTRRLEIPDRTNRYNEDFYISYKNSDGSWGKSMNLGMPINTFLNEGAQTISPDGKSIYFTACNRPDGVGRCDIFYSKKVGNTWSDPVNIGPPINTAAWESQPSISSDGNSLYFCSNRKGGVGKIDIWVSHKNEEGNWGEPINLGGRINTKLNDQSPFIHPDNETLFFSSEGHAGMGGEDIYLIRKDTNGKWGNPVNLGYPINTLNTETNLCVSSNGELAFFSSDGFDTKGELDIFYFELYPAARPKKVTYVKGYIFDKETKRRLTSKIELIDLATGDIVIETYSDKIDGSYLVCLLAGKNYAFNISKKGYLFHSENFSLKDRDPDRPYQLNIGLQRIKVGQSVVLKNIFFETDSYGLKPESKVELLKLTDLLKENPKLKIEFGGHTDNVGEKSYNRQLSENRAKAVYEYLLEKGVEPARLSYKGYGDTLPIASNETAEGRALNRRTTFTVVGE